MRRSFIFPRAFESLLFLLSITLFLVSCDTGGGDAVWLDSLQNPFLGEWEADIPSAQTHLFFTYKADGTFDFKMANGTTGTGAYVIKDNMMATYLDFEGAVAYRFKVIDNDTIDVTELEGQVTGGTWTWQDGNTSSFTRVPGSAVNRENKPFVLTNDIVGIWHSADTVAVGGITYYSYEVTSKAGKDGTFEMDTQYSDIADFVLEMLGGEDPSGISKGIYSMINNKLFIYTYENTEKDENPLSVSTVEKIDANTIRITIEGEEAFPMIYTRQGG